MKACPRILVVDDDRDLCWVLERVLEESHYEPIVAFTGAEARRCQARAPADLVLVDYRLPDTDGIALIGSLDRAPAPPPAILMTSYPTASLFAQASEAGFAATLTKPFLHSELLRVLAALPLGRPLEAASARNEPGTEGIGGSLVVEGIVHDLGNPIHSAISTLDYLQTKLRHEASPHEELVTVTLHALQRADGMLRDFSALVKGNPPVRHRLDLSAVAGETLTFLEVLCDEHRVALRRSLGAGLPPVLGNPREIGRLLGNLVANSLEAMEGIEREPAHRAKRGSGPAAPTSTDAARSPERGTPDSPNDRRPVAPSTFAVEGELCIEVATAREVSEEGEWLVLSVADNGPGIPADVKECAGSPFVSSKGRGRGLGVFLCRQIARFHGGRITLVDRPGGGTLARVIFPVPAQPFDSSPADPGGSK